MRARANAKRSVHSILHTVLPSLEIWTHSRMILPDPFCYMSWFTFCTTKISFSLGLMIVFGGLSVKHMLMRHRINSSGRFRAQPALQIHSPPVVGWEGVKNHARLEGPVINISLLEVFSMKFGENRHWSVRQTSVKVLSIIGLAASTTLMLSGCGDPTHVALQPLATEPTLITIEATGE